MILLVHMLFGAAIGSAVKNVSLAIILAFLGHYFLDIFPHIEYLKSTEDSIKKIKNGKLGYFISDLLKVTLDFFLGILFVSLFSKNTSLIYACALVSIIPDGLTIVNLLISNKFLKKHQKIHAEKIHFLKHKKISNFWRIITQVLAVIISIFLLKS